MTFEELRQGIINYDSEAVKKVAKGIIEKGLNPLEAIKVLTDTLREQGEKYGRLEIFLPELMMAADAMKSGLDVLEPELRKRGGRAPIQTGTIMIGTVKGDIHDIGKTIVTAMLTAAGFDVIDIGKDVAISVFAETAEKNKPDIVAASALLTTTIPALRELVEYFKEIEIRDKYRIMVGGGAVTREYAEEIGADGYGQDAIESVEVAVKLMRTIKRSK